MSWRHVMLILIACALVGACVITRVCTESPVGMASVITLATTIVAGALGHAKNDPQHATEKK